jgi:hypothetical protein
MSCWYQEMRGAGMCRQSEHFYLCLVCNTPPSPPRIHPWEEGIARENQYLTNQFNSSISHLPLADSD